MIPEAYIKKVQDKTDPRNKQWALIYRGYCLEIYETYSAAKNAGMVDAYFRWHAPTEGWEYPDGISFKKYWKLGWD